MALDARGATAGPDVTLPLLAARRPADGSKPPGAERMDGRQQGRRLAVLFRSTHETHDGGQARDSAEEPEPSRHASPQLDESQADPGRIERQPFGLMFTPIGARTSPFEPK